MSLRGLCFFLSGLLLLPSRAEVRVWDLSPIDYTKTKPADRLEALNVEWKSRPELWKEVAPLDLLRRILKELEIPESSQVLVFSKTSLQNSRITPSNPRALYHGLNAYVGYVPGGNIEVIAEDPKLGFVYRVFDVSDRERLFVQQTEDCFSCHANGRTEDVPGVLVRSVFPDGDGRPLLAFGSHLVDHTTPIQHRWGGYYVTGAVGMPHLGNRIYQDGGQPSPEERDIDKLPANVDTRGYLRPTSDVVSLLVLEHQCRVHNLLHAASISYQRSGFMERLLDPKSDLSRGSAAKIAESCAEKIVGALFYAEEADLGDGVEGDAGYQEDFRKSLPATKDGKSLGDFRLLGRMMKLRCSHMVYSDAYRNLPAGVRFAVQKRMREVLTSAEPGKDFTFLKPKERREIHEILLETLPGYAE